MRSSVFIKVVKSDSVVLSLDLRTHKMLELGILKEIFVLSCTQNKGKTKLYSSRVHPVVLFVE